ncbi:hypothetical protein T440DRAFT_552733 [Plenodomus tracheiphilus IPT5]|uniref:Uncharacterized protein n=1 Tax=Plenodomus tracheiphilus IPT5 TaxID=1408161 RepID=A0A6A7BDL1_9PLEO|nr:hypothetical protein T440DRAFT_552733 [Plenodomus tracheiphilus IPT5]
MTSTEVISPVAACVSPTFISSSTHKLKSGFFPSHAFEDSCTFRGKKFTFPGGSKWRVEEPLSALRLQQESSPCEATQVFTAHRLTDPSSDDSEPEQAVIKVKFQIKAPDDTVRYYEDWLHDYEEDLRRWPDPSDHDQEAVEDARDALRWCTEPTVMPSNDAVSEHHALGRLAESKCQHAPWLLDCMQLAVQADTHPMGIIGGYLTMVLMTKLPGVCLDYKYLHGLSFADRNNLREDFRKALVNVWDNGVDPVDSARRNLIWNREARICYVIDYEGCDIDAEDSDQPLEFIEDVQYDAWDLTEESVFGSGSG